MTAAESRAEGRRLEYVTLDDVFIKLPTQRLGKDTVYVDLPEGTRAVKKVGGSIRLALPVKLKINF